MTKTSKTRFVLALAAATLTTTVLATTVLATTADAKPGSLRGVHGTIATGSFSKKAFTYHHGWHRFASYPAIYLAGGAIATCEVDYQYRLRYVPGHGYHRVLVKV